MVPKEKSLCFRKKDEDAVKTAIVPQEKLQYYDISVVQ